MGAEVHQHVVPHAIRFKSMVAEDIRASLGPSSSHNVKGEVKAGVDAEVNPKGEGICRLNLHVQANHNGENVCDIEVRLKGVFDSETPLENEKFRAFLKDQGIALLLPFGREVIANLSLRMGLPPIMIPLISVFDTARRIQQAGSAQEERANKEAPEGGE